MSVMAEALGEFLLSKLFGFVEANNNLLTTQLDSVHGVHGSVG